jgi:hypothetical protein
MFIIAQQSAKKREHKSTTSIQHQPIHKPETSARYYENQYVYCSTTVSKEIS